MTGIMTDLSIAGRLLGRSLTGGHRGKIPTPDDIGAFQSTLQAALDAIDPAMVAQYRWVSMAATEAPWVDSGLNVEEGDEVSWFACGRCYASKLLDIWVDPRVQVWGRIGDKGNIISATRLSHTVQAERGGQLMFGNYFPNDWADPQGTLLQDETVYKAMSGGVAILAIRWAVPAREGLAALRDAGDFQDIVANEIERLDQGDITPAGWQHLFNVGNTEIYSEATTDERPCIHCNTRADAGILQKDVDMPLTKDATLSWRWCVENLPSTLREDSLPSHDYLSIAVEFDNGRDITYYWSHNLKEGTGYDCPLPNWKGKEYHVVVRSGEADLGKWLQESRNLYQDYLHYMGEPPQRIVRVWLIANSAFQRRPGDCIYSDIVLHDNEQKINVL